MIINIKRIAVPIVRGRDSEGYLEMFDCFLAVALDTVYFAKNVATFDDNGW